ncbi:PepSY domain-containing protein [Teredinibacter sp. KSP-S5-2]|uniref:PepSY domain-containing protein n=1 Tax=Teredinibacter sp. KSP-S5-2 TaxID=3034506 RepID=UPI002934BAAB|nr:PepSY domain-containing protein [Teredinibacter sp. KSP-S5-2]WNO09495.1 hypothetical protein P5V12_21380 [Teredinibacter sp. KSP-S5-2]
MTFRTITRSCIGMVTALIMLCAVPSHAGKAYPSHHDLWLAQNNVISEGQAAAIAKQRHGGKVLSVQKQNQNGKTIYKVKLLQDSGRVKIVTINGNRGG